MTNTKRVAQNKVVKMLLLGIHRAVIYLMDSFGLAAEFHGRCKSLKRIGVPYGSRTRVAAVKGRCPRPLDERDAQN